jgi:HEAT repeat protein
MGCKNLLRLLVAAAAIGVQSGAFAQEQSYVAQLRAAGISPTREGIAKYLQSLVPNEERQRQLQDLVQQLGDSNFNVRQQAQAALEEMPSPPVDLLRQAADSSDAEIRFRARQILAAVSGGDSRLAIQAVLNYIVDRRLTGLAQPLLEFLPHWDDHSPYGLAARALIATAGRDDAPLLQKTARSGPAGLRPMTLRALAEVLQAEAASDLTELLGDKDLQVRIVAAEALANLGRRESLAALVVLLDVDDRDVRSRAGEVLRNFTRQDFSYVAYDKPETRAAAVAQWRQWVAAHGESAKVYFPLSPHQQFVGRTLMSLYPNTLREIDAEGVKQFERRTFTYVWGCHATADGRRLVADYSKRFIVEYNAAGEQVWLKGDLPGPPADCRLLDDGRVLLALGEANQVIEIDREGNTVWSVDVEGRPTTAERLPNGHTLINLQLGKRVVEVDPAGKVVWELGGIDNALTAQGLANGNVLVCEMNLGKAVEFNRAGRKVWEHAGFENACQAQRLPGGNTLVSDSSGLHEISPTGEKVWSLKVPRGRFWRY